MKRLIFAIALAGILWAEPSVQEPLPPYSVQAPSGKPSYQPIREPVNVVEEIRIQQENGVIGGRGVPMHSYGDTNEEHAPHGEH
ncbi:MAG: hypothetical protein JXK04_02985 [Campylobacterales bacterium]|nr:hypothetical protein [Campylobacterales bacterium]